MNIEQRHIDNAKTARQLYLETLKPLEAGEDWRFAVRKARRLVALALRDSDFLSDIGRALRRSGTHSLVFRHLLAPPLSQDQFKLACPAWNKNSEISGTAMSEENAKAAAETFNAYLDTGLTRWDRSLGPVARRDVVVLLKVVSTLIASQTVSTDRRRKLSTRQESTIIEALVAAGWKKLPSQTIDMRAAVPRLCFMHKTRFATATTATQEVDIACGLAGTYVLAMECKVTNDETNSVKRINDVLKKATAWKTHWGSFVETAALLEGVIAAKDVQRLSDAGVHVFWSHDLAEFKEWLAGKTLE